VIPGEAQRLDPRRWLGTAPRLRMSGSDLQKARITVRRYLHHNYVTAREQYKTAQASWVGAYTCRYNTACDLHRVGAYTPGEGGCYGTRIIAWYVYHVHDQGPTEVVCDQAPLCVGCQEAQAYQAAQLAKAQETSSRQIYEAWYTAFFSPH
jgi:hypothetical protein